MYGNLAIDIKLENLFDWIEIFFDVDCQVMEERSDQRPW